MSSKVARSIRRGLTQALAYAKHEAREADYRVHVPAEIDGRAIREKLGLTQAQFAARFAFRINTLRHWEQGKRKPERPSRAWYLLILRRRSSAHYARRPAYSIPALSFR
jgi:putative transcriptional regulator